MSIFYFAVVEWGCRIIATQINGRTVDRIIAFGGQDNFVIGSFALPTVGILTGCVSGCNIDGCTVESIDGGTGTDTCI